MSSQQFLLISWVGARNDLVAFHDNQKDVEIHFNQAEDEVKFFFLILSDENFESQFVFCSLTLFWALPKIS